MKTSKILALVSIAALIAAFFVFDLGHFFDHYFSLEYFKSQQAAIEGYYLAHPVQTGLAFFLVYIAVTALSLPGAALMTLAGGAIFGLLWGCLLYTSPSPRD